MSLMVHNMGRQSSNCVGLCRKTSLEVFLSCFLPREVFQIVLGGILNTSETAKTKVKKVKKVTGNGLLVSNKCLNKG